MASEPQTQALSQEIDRLLEHYLSLLSQYDALRSELSALQASIQQNLARANFDAQRGIRYGADLYDERMQAVRLCHITPPAPSPLPSPSPSPSFTVQHEDMQAEELKEDEKLNNEETEKEDGDGEQKQKQKVKERQRDPLRMFGILTPQSLRTAQKGAIEMVEGIIPKLVSIDAEMKEVEIQVRRARKFRGKAQGAEVKDGEKVLEERREVLVGR